MSNAPASLEQRAACADHHELVDQAFANPRGPAAKRLAGELCPTCPIWEACLTWALDNGEHGPWGGTTERERRKRVKRGYHYNMRMYQSSGQSEGALGRTRHLTAHGATSGDVRAWARQEGLEIQARGVPTWELIHAYLEARDAVEASC